MNGISITFKPTTIITHTIHFNQLLLLKENALQWAFSFGTCCYLDSNEYDLDAYHQVEGILGVGIQDSVSVSGSEALNSWKAFRTRNANTYQFGYLGYDLKNAIEPTLSSHLPDYVGLEDLYFFVPETVIQFYKDRVCIESSAMDPELIWQTINNWKPVEHQQQAVGQFKHRTDASTYFSDIAALQEHLRLGSIYEINYCQEFYLENCQLSPLQLYQAVNEVTKAPYSAFLKLDEKYVLCCSPERFLQKKGSQLIAQPIKGTSKRNKDVALDEELKLQLQQSKKEQAENVMIVDLMRNDMARCGKVGTTKVEDLFGVYTFKTVHQLISTISTQLDSDQTIEDILPFTFPAGSMTGAPKISAMKLIEHYEKVKRGLFSGSIGYITPSNDFDFNVVIRTLIYNQERAYLSLQTGGAITLDSTAAEEYAESLLKAEALMNALNGL